MKAHSTIPTLVALLCAPLCGAQVFEESPFSESASAGSEAPVRPLDLAALAEAAPPVERAGDGRRTLGRFFPNLGRNLVGVLSPRNAAPLAFGAALTGAGSMFDGRGKRYFTQGGRAEEFGKIGQTVGGMTFMGPMTAGLFLAGRASHDTRFRAATYDVLQASLVAGAYTTALKLGVGRERPDGSNRLSFPSGHTSHAFAWAAVLDRHYGRRTGVAAYAVAGLIGVSRMERNKHHLSDVLAGATLGWLAGRTVVREDGEAPADGRRFTLAPVADPSGSGVGLGVSLSF